MFFSIYNFLFFFSSIVICAILAENNNINELFNNQINFLHYPTIECYGAYDGYNYYDIYNYNHLENVQRIPLSEKFESATRNVITVGAAIAATGTLGCLSGVFSTVCCPMATITTAIIALVTLSQLIVTNALRYYEKSNINSCNSFGNEVYYPFFNAAFDWEDNQFVLVDSSNKDFYSQYLVSDASENSENLNNIEYDYYTELAYAMNSHSANIPKVPFNVSLHHLDISIAVLSVELDVNDLKSDNINSNYFKDNINSSDLKTKELDIETVTSVHFHIKKKDLEDVSYDPNGVSFIRPDFISEALNNYILNYNVRSACLTLPLSNGKTVPAQIDINQIQKNLDVCFPSL